MVEFSGWLRSGTATDRAGWLTWKQSASGHNRSSLNPRPQSAQQEFLYVALRYRTLKWYLGQNTIF